jgi:hypothetical protein
LRQAVLQQFIGRRLMLPQSDRSDGAKSGCVEGQKNLFLYAKDDIESEFVLPDHCSHGGGRGFRKRPAQHLFKGAKGFDLSENIAGHHYYLNLDSQFVILDFLRRREIRQALLRFDSGKVMGMIFLCVEAADNFGIGVKQILRSDSNLYPCPLKRECGSDDEVFF